MRKILVVDDRSEIRKLLAITLGLDFEILLATDAKEGILMAKASKPAAILLDVMMPGDVDGFWALKEIKSDPEMQNVKVAMLTAKGKAEDVKLGQKLGADAYFVKPFSPLQLVKWLEENLK